MLNNVGDLITEVLVRNNRTTTDSFITDAMLQDWVRQAHKWASAYHKWPFTEVRDNTLTYSTEEVPYSSFNVDYKADSIRILQIGDKRLKKLNFEDYLTFKEEEPSSDDRVFSDFGRILYIHAGDLTGTITAWGQYDVKIDPTDYTATTIFSDYDEEGNEAIIEKASSYLKRREHMVEEAELHDQRALAKLEEIWKRILDEQYKYQTHPAAGGQFERLDVVNGGFKDELFNRDQF